MLHTLSPFKKLSSTYMPITAHFNELNNFFFKKKTLFSSYLKQQGKCQSFFSINFFKGNVSVSNSYHFFHITKILIFSLWYFFDIATKLLYFFVEHKGESKMKTKMLPIIMSCIFGSSFLTAYRMVE